MTRKYHISKYNKQLGVAGLLARERLTVQQAHGQEAVKAHARHTDCDIVGLADYSISGGRRPEQR